MSTAVTALGSFLEVHNGAITALATVVIAGFTIVLAYVTARQARLTRELAESTKMAAQAAKASAEAVPALERAYVYIELVSGVVLQSDQPLSVNFYFANHGKTPATVTALYYYLEYREDKNPPTLEDPRRDLAGSWVIAGNDKHGSIVATLYEPLTSQKIENVARGVGRIFFTARILYEDVFGHAHETRACYQYAPGLGAGEFAQYGEDELNRRT